MPRNLRLVLDSQLFQAVPQAAQRNTERLRRRGAVPSVLIQRGLNDPSLNASKVAIEVTVWSPRGRRRGCAFL